MNMIMIWQSSVLFAISIFGIFSNVVNMLVFYRMGFTITTNISLFCLAIADFYTLVFILLATVGGHPMINDDHLFISLEDLTKTIGTLYYGCTAMGSWITAVISVERSCCVAFPMKVKHRYWYISGAKKSTSLKNSVKFNGKTRVVCTMGY